MTDSPTPEQIYARAKEEGRRRLGMPPLEQAATGFIAGVTIVFGIVALGVVTSHIETDLGSGVATVFGAAAFGIGLVFLVVGRSELFTEDFFDPVAVAVDERKGSTWVGLARLWAATLILNLVGGSILVAVLTVEGALPAGSVETLVAIAEELAAKGWAATLARAVLAGALITLLSYLLNATDSATSRILLALHGGVLAGSGPLRPCRGVGTSSAVRDLAVRRCLRRRPRPEHRPGHGGQPGGRADLGDVLAHRPGESARG